MKSIKLFKILTVFMVLLSVCLACDEDDDNGDASVYNGTYMGFGFDGITKISCWKIEISNGIISGIAILADANGTITGTVNANGQVAYTAIIGGKDPYHINVIATISETALSGTWDDDIENDKGAVSGNKVIAAEVSQYNGIFSGYAYDGKTRVGSWKINIDNGFITAIGTSESDDGALNGIVNAQGEVIFVTFGEDEDIINISTTISDNTITGIWTNTINGERGSMSGSKVITGDEGDVSCYNGIYIGFAYRGTIKQACWRIEISNGSISGIGYSGEEYGLVTGTISANGQVAFTAIMADKEATHIKIKATIIDNALAGTFTDNDGSGTLSGNKVIAAEVSKYNGTYSGFSYLGTTKVGSWKININNGYITPIGTSKDDDGAISGIVNAQGEITAMTIVGIEGEGDGEESLHISASISGNKITGTWVGTVSSGSGTFAGDKE